MTIAFNHYAGRAELLRHRLTGFYRGQAILFGENHLCRYIERGGNFSAV